MKKYINRIIYIIGIFYMLFLFIDAFEEKNIVKMLFTLCSAYTIISLFTEIAYK